jgi:hypothetical protein
MIFQTVQISPSWRGQLAESSVQICPKLKQTMAWNLHSLRVSKYLYLALAFVPAKQVVFNLLLDRRQGLQGPALLQRMTLTTNSSVQC